MCSMPEEFHNANKLAEGRFQRLNRCAFRISPGAPGFTSLRMHLLPRTCRLLPRSFCRRKNHCRMNSMNFLNFLTKIRSPRILNHPPCSCSSLVYTYPYF